MNEVKKSLTVKCDTEKIKGKIAENIGQRFGQMSAMSAIADAPIACSPCFFLALVPSPVLGVLVPSPALGVLVPSPVLGVLVPSPVLGVLVPSPVLGVL